MTVGDNIEIQRVKRSIEAKSSEHRKEVQSILSKCSCPECDSLKCFILRRGPDNNLCNCLKKSKSCCNKREIAMLDTKPKFDISRVISQVNKTVDICTKISHDNTLNSSTVDTIIHSSISYKSIAQDSDNSQESFSDVEFAINPLRNCSENTAHLSAQIMKAGCFQDFNDCISLNEPYKESVAEINNMREYIYRKLKEIYNACSCKVCECIPTTPFSTRKSTCSCKPCQCDDCKKRYSYVGSHLKEKPHVGCPCISCDRKDCRGVVKKLKPNCSCKPCDCFMCTESLAKNCNCTPCSCVDCKYRPSYLTRSYIVAAVDQSNRSTTCNCESPCECSNCIPTYGTTGSSQERSTGTLTRAICPCNSCTNQSCQSDGENCRCNMQKHIMSKPIERGHHDCDIRNLILENTHVTKGNYKSDFISMCANVRQKFCMGDDPYQYLQSENRFATQYIKLSLRNKVLETKSSNCTYYTGDCNDGEDLKSSETKINPQLQNALTFCSLCCHCEFCKRQQFDYYINSHIENIIQNHTIPNNKTSDFNELTAKKPPKLLLSKSNCNVGQSNQHMKARRVEISKQTINRGTIKLNPFATAQNSINSICRKNKLKRINTELLITKHNRLYYVASILKNFSLFGEGSNSPCNESNIEYTSSLKTLLSATPDPAISASNDVPHNLNRLDVEECNFRKSSAFPFFNTLYEINQKASKAPKISISTFDYAKIQKTLLQAQEYSTKLRGVLESYEEANNNFVSVSHRLRRLYDDMISNYTSDKETYKDFTLDHFRHGKDTKKLYYGGDRISITHETDSMAFSPSLTTCPSSNSNKGTLKPILGSHNLLENLEYVTSCGVFSEEDIFREAISNCCTRLGLNYSYSTINDALKAFKRQKSLSEFCKKIILDSQRKINKYVETDSQNIKFSRSTCMQNDKGQQDEKLNTNITFRDADFYKDEITETNTKESLHINSTDVVFPSTKLMNHKETKNLHWNILRKNIFLDSGLKPNHNSDMPRLQENIKDIIRIISEEIRREFMEKDSMCYQSLNKRKENYDTVRIILDEVVSMVVLKSNKSKSFNQENRKANFIDIKRISDHTILVKWNIPNNISNILGYELQVDGRAVTKIFSPRCALAVISCLPRNERVLLTIVTITDSEGPNSSNTIVHYNPPIQQKLVVN